MNLPVQLEGEQEKENFPFSGFLLWRPPPEGSIHVKSGLSLFKQTDGESPSQVYPAACLLIPVNLTTKTHHHSMWFIFTLHSKEWRERLGRHMGQSVKGLPFTQKDLSSIPTTQVFFITTKMKRGCWVDGARTCLLNHKHTFFLPRLRSGLWSADLRMSLFPLYRTQEGEQPSCSNKNNQGIKMKRPGPLVTS